LQKSQKSNGPQTFYVNYGCDVFQLQVGKEEKYRYPVFSLAEYVPVTYHYLGMNDDSLETALQLQEFRATYGSLHYKEELAPTATVPELFENIHNLVLSLTIPPSRHQPGTPRFDTWAQNAVQHFWRSAVERMLPKFPSLTNLNFLIHRDVPNHPKDKVILKDWRQMQIRETSGDIVFGHAALGFLEWIRMGRITCSLLIYPHSYQVLLSTHVRLVPCPLYLKGCVAAGIPIYDLALAQFPKKKY